MTAPGVRLATPDDAAAIIRISFANDETFEVRPDGHAPYVEHLLARSRVVVADVDGEVAGFAATIDLAGIHHLTDCFVAPTAHGRGIGRAMLDAAFPSAGERTTFSSSHPAALPLYIGAGMDPWWPLEYVAGGTAASLPTTSLGSSSLTASAAARLEVALGGIAREPDFRHWTDRPGGGAFAVLDQGHPVGVGVRGEGRLGRLRIDPQADPVEVVLAALGTSGSVDGQGGTVTGLAIPGPHPALRRLHELGWRDEGRDTFMASRPDLVDPVRLLPSPSLL